MEVTSRGGLDQGGCDFPSLTFTHGHVDSAGTILENLMSSLNLNTCKRLQLRYHSINDLHLLHITLEANIYGRRRLRKKQYQRLLDDVEHY